MNDVTCYAHQAGHTKPFSGYKYNFAWSIVQNAHACGTSQKTGAAFLQTSSCDLLVSPARSGTGPA